MKKCIFVVSILFLNAIPVFAGGCVLHFDRTACTGKETESYSKCKGTKACDEAPIEVASEKECAKKALKACDNARLDITKSKIVTAKFDGKDVDGGKNFCAADRSDFNKCN